jgi:hypothetical protein
MIPPHVVHLFLSPRPSDSEGRNVGPVGFLSAHLSLFLSNVATTERAETRAVSGVRFHTFDNWRPNV